MVAKLKLKATEMTQNNANDFIGIDSLLKRASIKSDNLESAQTKNIEPDSQIIIEEEPLQTIPSEKQPEIPQIIQNTPHQNPTKRPTLAVIIGTISSLIFLLYLVSLSSFVSAAIVVAIVFIAAYLKYSPYKKGTTLTSAIITLLIYVGAIIQIITLKDELLQTLIYQMNIMQMIIAVGIYLVIALTGVNILLQYLSNLKEFLFKGKIKTAKKSVVPKQPSFIDNFSLTIGEVHNPETGARVENPTLLNLNAKSLFTNLFVFGSIGSGKTAFLYSVLEQLFHTKSMMPL